MGSITISDQQLVEKIREQAGQLALKDLAIEAYATRAGELEAALETQYERHPEDRPAEPESIEPNREQRRAGERAARQRKVPD
jgi:hypothetical protein